ncbi:MAG: glutamine amidotransferase [Clostridia bacterium]|nr:glutamine amidotransferase [Clostridia bacterium]
MEANILHLYYDILNLYGEYGNVVIMKKHLEEQGFTVNVDKKTIGDTIDFQKYSFIYMGCGTEKNLSHVLKDIRKYETQIRNCIANKTVILATGNSFEVFGKNVEKEKGLGIFDFECVTFEDRITGDVIYESLNDNYKVVGSINKMTEIYHNMLPLFKVQFGIGENKKNDFEGVNYLNFYGTHILGPVLSRNPEFLKKLIIEIGTNLDEKFKYIEKEYPYEETSHQLILSELENKK